MFLFLYLIIMVELLVALAFYTLMERRILGNFHIRIGPNQVGPMGMFQPFSDAIKLFTKTNLSLINYEIFFYIFSPLLAIFIFLFSVSFFPISGGIYFSSMSMLYYLALLSASVYFVIFGGFYSGSKYSLLGSYRAVTQMISYEIALIFFFVTFMIMMMSVDFSLVVSSSSKISIFFISVPFFLVWLLTCLAESNRLPFDFMEGESELVSGFNVEYWGGFFSLIFIYEYGFMVYFCILSGALFFSSVLFPFIVMFVLYFYLWIRSTVPRLRYDFLMMMLWKKLLILVMSIFIFMIMF